ncbi:MAG: DUF192 domain-containing protein [Candidatus Omnitrophica bacterium]|nr:DUF192 domain-containing protein [Candidatus Omnitrophota bacterium]
MEDMNDLKVNNKRRKTVFSGCLLFLLTSFCLLLTLAGCRPADAASRVCFKEACYAVELAQTTEARERGLMFREGLKPGQGMFFIFDTEDELPFWMKDMKFSIDIIWINAARKVVHIEPNLPVCQAEPCTIYYPHAKARYVLEIPAGDALRHGLSVGQDVSF